MSFFLFGIEFVEDPDLPGLILLTTENELFGPNFDKICYSVILSGPIKSPIYYSESEFCFLFRRDWFEKGFLSALLL